MKNPPPLLFNKRSIFRKVSLTNYIWVPEVPDNQTFNVLDMILVVEKEFIFKIGILL